MSRILLVDDEAVAREVIGAQLEKLGHTVFSATSIEEARAAFSENGLDMALVDIRLGEDSGLDLLPAFKAQDPDCQIALITAYASVDTAAEAMRMGASDYLVKPVQPHDLLRAVERCLEHKRVLEENRRLEEENRRHREQLEEKVLEQTVDLAEKEKRWRTVFETIRDLYYRTDMEGRVTNVSPSCLPLTGYSPEEIIGTDVTTYYADPRQRDALLQALQKNGSVNDFEVELVHKDGTHRIASVTSHIVFDDENYPVAVEGIGRDITERKKAEEEIRKLSTAIEQSPASVIITDAEGNIEYVNEAFATLTGFSSKEVLGKNPNVLKSGENPPAVYDELWQTILSGRTWRGELCNKNKDGTLGWDDVSISPLKNKQEEITHFVGVQFDITNRKQAEEALNEQMQKLERFNQLAVGREMKMIELKEEINALLREAGRKEKYVIHRASELDDGKQGA